MYCMQCGNPLAPEARFCGACGAEVRSSGQPVRAAGDGKDHSPKDTPSKGDGSAARVLLRFGPMGIGITSKPPSLFTVTYQNCTEIIADTRYLWGVRKMPKFAFARHGKQSGQTVFQIPYDQIISVTRADYLANKALWIRYRQGGEEKGVGIEAAILHHQHVLDLQKLLQKQVNASPGR